jgi:acyl-CoA synthetase (NDP forming)
MRRTMRPRSIAVIGASAEEGKIGYSIVRNIIDGGFEGKLYPVNPRAPEIQGLKAYPSIGDIPDEVDVAVFAIPAPLVAGAMEQAGQKGVASAILVPSGFAEVGEKQLQDDMVAVARRHNIRVMGPNIYGYYYTPSHLCATFCTPYTEQGTVALSSQSGGVGMAIIGFSRSHKMGVSAIVGLGNKSDLDEDDLLEFYAEDPNTQVIAMHVEDLKDGRAFVDAAKRISKEKPVIVLKAGRTAQGARAAAATPAPRGDRPDLRRRLPRGGRRAGEDARGFAGLVAGGVDAAGAEGRERAHRHGRRRFGRAAFGLVHGLRAQPHEGSARPRRGVQRTNSAVRGVREPD